MPQKMIYGLLFAGLLLETVFDLKKKQIWVPVIFAEVPALLLLNYAAGKGSALLWAASFGMGALLWAGSVLSRGQMGKGDALLFAMTGAGLGLLDNVALLYLSFFFAFFAAAFLWLVKKKKKDHKIPLAPFVLLAYCVLLFAGKGMPCP